MRVDGGRGEPRKEADYRMAVEAARRAADTVGRARREGDLGADGRVYKPPQEKNRFEPYRSRRRDRSPRFGDEPRDAAEASEAPSTPQPRPLTSGRSALCQASMPPSRMLTWVKPARLSRLAAPLAVMPR